MMMYGIEWSMLIEFVMYNFFRTVSLADQTLLVCYLTFPGVSSFETIPSSLV
jgi:hypothetical protein